MVFMTSLVGSFSQFFHRDSINPENSNPKNSNLQNPPDAAPDQNKIYVSKKSMTKVTFPEGSVYEGYDKGKSVIQIMGTYTETNKETGEELIKIYGPITFRSNKSKPRTLDQVKTALSDPNSPLFKEVVGVIKTARAIEAGFVNPEDLRGKIKSEVGKMAPRISGIGDSNMSVREYRDTMRAKSRTIAANKAPPKETEDGKELDAVIKSIN